MADGPFRLYVLLRMPACVIVRAFCGVLRRVVYVSLTHRSHAFDFFASRAQCRAPPSSRGSLEEHLLGLMPPLEAVSLKYYTARSRAVTFLRGRKDV